MEQIKELQKEIWFLKLGYFFLFGVSIYQTYKGYGAYEMLVLIGFICISLIVRGIIKNETI